MHIQFDDILTFGSNYLSFE